MELFKNKRVMANMNKAISVLGNAFAQSGVEWKQGDKFGIKDVLAVFVKYPDAIPAPLRGEVEEFYNLFCAEIHADLKAEL